MKLAKMSLAAALLMGASAFAIENTKVSGDAKLYYTTNDAEQADGDSGSLFEKDNSNADAAFNLGVTTDLAKGLSAGAKLSIVSTLGLENNLVSGTFGNSHGVTGNASDFGAQADDAYWMSEAWVAASMANTTAKLGRMELDTPLVFSETWSVETNTFESAVLINTDIPDTTIVAAFVGRSNDATRDTAVGTLNDAGLTQGGVVAQNGKFNTFGLSGLNAVVGTNYRDNGAYAFAVVNNSYKPLTVQAWYYDVLTTANAYWLQADYSLDSLGLTVGAQYTAGSLDDDNGVAAGDVDLNAYALKVGYAMDALSVSAAYSQIGEDFGWGGNLAASGASKLYTEAWWNYTYITQADTASINVTAEYAVKDVADFGLYFTQADQSADAGSNDLQEVTVTASVPVGFVNATLAYINTDAENQNAGDAYNSVQVYLDASF